jgi:hypothetical protein
MRCAICSRGGFRLWLIALRPCALFRQILPVFLPVSRSVPVPFLAAAAARRWQGWFCRFFFDAQNRLF